MTARLLAFAIWAAVAATVVFWGLRLFVTPPAAPPHVVAVTAGTPRADMTRLLGAGAASAPSGVPVAAASSRFKLVGVVAPRTSGGSVGVALIAVDDKPARPYRIGAVVDNSWVVQTVHRRGVSLGPSGGAAELSLELPQPQAAATGTLPAAPALQPPAVPPRVPAAPAVAPQMSAPPASDGAPAGAAPPQQVPPPSPR